LRGDHGGDEMEGKENWFFSSFETAGLFHFPCLIFDILDIFRIVVDEW
jgi:hypothetical protein